MQLSPTKISSILAHDHFHTTPEMAASHFLQVQVKSQVISLQVQVKSQVISVQVQVKSQVIWSDGKSSHKSVGPNTSQVTSLLICPSTSQVAHYFFHSRHKKGNIIKSKRK